MSLENLPDEWTVWADDSNGRTVLVYRPDVFDGSQFPAPCLPTIYVSDGSRRPRPGASGRSTDTWHASLLLEPEIEGPSERYDSREAALDGAVELARRFADGEVDYRSLYQVPRETYFEKLDDLTGREA